MQILGKLYTTLYVSHKYLKILQALSNSLKLSLNPVGLGPSRTHQIENFKNDMFKRHWMKIKLILSIVSWLDLARNVYPFPLTSFLTPYPH